MPATGTSRPSRPRGRRPAANVPCSDCIARASEKKEQGASIELCSKCTAALHRPRRKSDQSSVKRMRRQSATLPDAASTNQTGPSTITPWSGDLREQHSMQFFATHSTPQLAGYFDSPFWQRMVLQTGQHEPAVRHAIAAIGALHETLLTGAIDPALSSEDRRTRYALEQCNASIQHLVKPSRPKSKPDLQLMLTTCVLYTCFEALQGHCEQAIIHATQGYSLLQQYAMDPNNKRWDVGAFAVELDQLSLLMRRLQTQSRSLSLGQTLRVLPHSESINKMQQLNFHTLQEASSTLERTLSHLLNLFLDMELDDSFYQLVITDSDRQLTYKPWLSEWEKSFSTFLSTNQPSLSDEDRKVAMMLKAHHLVAEILAGVDVSLNELGWDAFQENFSAIVNLATAVLKNPKAMKESRIGTRWDRNDNSESAPSSGLSFSLGIVDPLFEVCARCREPTLRRRALDMLASHPRQDCVWSSQSVWKVGKLLMQRENSEAETSNGDAQELPIDQQTPRPSISVSQYSPEHTGPDVSYTRPINRVRARHALNPGLFEELDTNVSGGETEIVDGLQYHESKLAFSRASLTPEIKTALAAALPDRYNTPDWIDYDAFQQVPSIPTILEHPPDD